MSSPYSEYLEQQAFQTPEPPEAQPNQEAEDQLVQSRTRQPNDESLPPSMARVMAIGGAPTSALAPPPPAQPPPAPTGGEDQVIPPPGSQPAQQRPAPGELFTLGSAEDTPPPPPAGVLSSFAGGLERGGAALHGQIGRVVSTVLRKTGEWTDQDWLKAGADALDKVTTDVDEGATKVGTVGDMSIAQAWKTGNFMNLIAEKVGEGLPVGALAVAAGSISPMIPIIYGVVTAGNDEARKPDATAASVLSQATIGGASMGLNLKIAQSFAGKQFVARALAQAGELGVFGAVTPFADQITEALHTGSQGYQAPSAEQVGSSVLGSVAMTPALMGAQRLLHGPQGPRPAVKTEGGTETLPSEGNVDPDVGAATKLALPAPSPENRPPIMFTMPTGPEQISGSDIVPPTPGTPNYPERPIDADVGAALTLALPAPSTDNRPPVIPLPGRVSGADVIAPPPGTVDRPDLQTPPPQLPPPSPENRPPGGTPAPPGPGQVSPADIVPPPVGMVDYASLQNNRAVMDQRLAEARARQEQEDQAPAIQATSNTVERSGGKPVAPIETAYAPKSSEAPPAPEGGMPVEPTRPPPIAPPGTPAGHTFEHDHEVPGQVVLKNPQGQVISVGDHPQQALDLAMLRARARGEVLGEAASAGGESATEAAPSLTTEATAPVAEAAATTGSAAAEVTTPVAKPPVVVETRRGKLEKAVAASKGETTTETLPAKSREQQIQEIGNNYVKEGDPGQNIVESVFKLRKLGMTITQAKDYLASVLSERGEKITKTEPSFEAKLRGAGFRVQIAQRLENEGFVRTPTGWSHPEGKETHSAENTILSAQQELANYEKLYRSQPQTIEGKATDITGQRALPAAELKTTAEASVPKVLPAGTPRPAEAPVMPSRTFGVREITPGRWNVTGPDGTTYGPKGGYTTQERAQAIADRARVSSSGDNRSTDAALVTKAASLVRSLERSKTAAVEDYVETNARLAREEAEAKARAADKEKSAQIAQDLKEAGATRAGARKISRGLEDIESVSEAEAKEVPTETRATETVGENKESAFEQRAKTSTDMVRDVAEPLIADYLKDPGMRTPGEIYDAYGEPVRKGGGQRRFKTFLQYLHDKITGIEKSPSDKAVIADANSQVQQAIDAARAAGKPYTRVQENELWKGASEYIVKAQRAREETLPALRELRSQIIGELSARSGTDKASTIHSDEDLYRIEKQGDKNANTYGSPDITGSKRAMHEESAKVNFKTWGRADNSALNGTSSDLHDYLNEIADNPGVRERAPHLAALARILRRAIRPGIAVHGDYDQRGAVYNDGTDSIHINPDISTPVRAIIHETVHAGTVGYLKDVGSRLRRGEVVTPRERQVYESLDALGRELTRMRANMNEADVSLKHALDYALSTEGGKIGRFQDHEELVTMLMTDPHVMDAMAREQASPVLLRELQRLDMMPVVPRRPTLYDTFRNIVGRIFGLTPDRVSVLDAALRPLTDTLREGTRFRNRQLDEYNQAPWHLSAKDYYSPDTVKGKITDRLPGDLPEKLSDLGSRLQSFGKDGFVGAASKSAETARQWFDREARTRKAGLGTSGKRIANEAGLISAPTTMIAQWNRNLPEVRDIARARSMQEEARSNTFSRWGDRVKGWVSDLKNAGDGFEHLRNEVSRVEADVIKGDFTHVRPENLAYAQELKGRYDKLPDRQKELFGNLVDYHATTGHDERQAWMEHVVDRAMGGGIDEAVRRDPKLGQITDNAGNELRSPEERANAIRKEIADIARSKTKIDELSKNPDGSDLSKLMGEHWAPSRDIVKLLATVQSRGWRQGNFTSLQRHGDYLVVHGDKLTGDKYGVHRFERPGEAQLFREDFKKTHPNVDISDIRLIDTTGSKDFLSGRMQTELGKALERAGISGDAAEEIQRSFGGMVLQHGINTMAARYAARRRGIYGASKNGAMNLVRDLAGHASRMGYLAHSAEETRAYNNLDKRVRQIEQPRRPGTPEEIAASQKLLDAAEERYKKGDVAISRDEIEDLRQQHEWLKQPPEGDAITAEQVKKELEARRLPIDHDDTARRFGDVAKKFTSASFVLHLMRPAHLAVQVADAQSQGLSYLGGAHGFARAGAALTKNIGRFAPPGMRAGGRAMLNAVRGQMKQADWMVSKAYEKRLVDSGMHAGEVKALMTEANHWGLVNQSMEREIQRTAKDGFGFGGSILHVPGNMMDLFAAAEHMTDSVNRMAILTSAYELKKIDNGGKLNDGKVDQNAIDHAINMTNMAMPNYGAWNKPRLASERGPLGPLGAAAMQYKIYGMNMYSGMAVLVRDAIKNPEQRAVALKSLAGIFATHALLVGATANMFGVPINVMTGLWDWLEGKPGPHDYENNMRKWLTDNWGPTASTFLSRGVLGLAGVDLHRSLKITNATDLPGVKTFDRAGVSGMIAQALTGASGDVAEQYADAAHQAMTGNIQKAIIGFAPRFIGDLVKAQQMATQGITDSKGKTILPAGRISTPAVVFQGLGFNPEEISAFRANRASGDEWIHEMSSAKSSAEARFVASGGKDRSAVQAYNRDRQLNQGILIRPQDLQTALKRARESIARPGSYGLSIPQREQRGVRAVTGFY